MEESPELLAYGQELFQNFLARTFGARGFPVSLMSGALR